MLDWSSRSGPERPQDASELRLLRRRGARGRGAGGGGGARCEGVHGLAERRSAEYQVQRPERPGGFRFAGPVSAAQQRPSAVQLCTFRQCLSMLGTPEQFSWHFATLPQDRSLVIGWGAITFVSAISVSGGPQRNCGSRQEWSPVMAALRRMPAVKPLVWRCGWWRLCMPAGLGNRGARWHPSVPRILILGQIDPVHTAVA